MKIFIRIFLIGFLSVPGTQFAAGQKEKLEEDEPTIVHRGHVTDKERQYSKIYQKSQKVNLSEVIRLNEQSGFQGVIDRTIITEPMNVRRLSPSVFLKFLTCSSDAIVFGSTTSKTAHLTEDESWAYTEYGFLVKEILKNNSKSPIEKGAQIEVTREGGLIRTDNHVFRFRNDGVQQLKKNGEYLLFLRFIPESNGYTIANRFGDFALENGRFNSLSTVPIPNQIKVENDLQTLFNNILNSLHSDCGLFR